MSALKGIGNGAKTELDVQHLRQLNVDWFYTWGHSPNLAGVQATDSFVPMTWSHNPDRLAQLPDVAGALPRAGALLGFNEPDHEKQANMSTGDARRAWPALEATGLRLGSPATIAPNAWWMNRFMLDAKADGLRIDFLTCHIYQNPHVGTFLRKIDEFHERWGLPVWVTETAVADWDATTLESNRYSRDQINDYMVGIVEGMRARPWLERFAWKTRAASDATMGTSALYNADGTLTSTGELYASL